VPNSELKNELSFERVLKCRLCSSTDLRIVFKLPDTPFGDRYLPPGNGARDANLIPLEVVHCGACNNFQTSVVVDTSSMYEHYLSRPGSVNQVLSDAYLEYAKDLQSVVNPSGQDLVVEIGSNDGLFISFFANTGVRCLGVDPAKNLSEMAASRGVATVVSFFGSGIAKKIVRDHGKAKLVIANFMFANVPQLDDFAMGVKLLLEDEGVFAIETNYVLDIVGNLQLEVVNHEHITYFSVTSLESFLAAYDLEIFFAKRVPAKSGSLRCYVQHKGAKFAIQKSVDAARQYEKVFGLFSETAWSPMAETVRHAEVASKEFFSRRKLDGIVGYGSSIGATTLIYALKIGEFLSALIDDDPYRQGLESPGWAIPTTKKEDIFVGHASPGYCAILAPRYVSQIVANNLNSVRDGVKFLRVWPVLEEVSRPTWQNHSVIFR